MPQPTGVYNCNGPTLIITLTEPISTDRFVADHENFGIRLRERAELPNQLRLVVAELFHRGAITDCSITWGTRLELWLARYHANTGRELLAGARLAHFQAIFSDITGQSIPTAWQGSTPNDRNTTSDLVNVDAVGHVVGTALQGALEGMKIAAALKILGGKE